MDDKTETPPQVVRRSLEAQAADVLRVQILSGRFQAGERVTETALAADLGLSRGPVRAALLQLSNEQLIVQRPYSGWEVRRLRPNDIWEINTLRGALEGLAARLAAQRIDARGERRLRNALKRLEAACGTGELEKVTEADFALHRMIIELAGHERLHHYYLLLEQQIRLLITATNEPFADLSLIADTHRDMIDAICRGNCAEAQRFAADHNAALDEALLTTAESVCEAGPETPAE